MNDLVRPSSYFTGGIAASAPSGVLATIPNPPPEVARLPAGTTLRGIVVGADGKGHVLVKTDQGTLAVATKANLAKNSEVVLQIRSSGTQLHVMLMQARGQGPAAGAPPQATARNAGAPPGSGGTGYGPGSSGNPTAALPPPPASGTRNATAASPGRADPLNLGQVVRAVVQGPAAPAQTAASPRPGPQGAATAGYSALAGVQPGQPPRPAPGTILSLRILSVSAPGPVPNLTASAGSGPPVLGAAGPPGFTPSVPQGPAGVLSPASGPAPAGAAVGVGPGVPAVPATPPGATVGGGTSIPAPPAESSARSAPGLPGTGPTAASGPATAMNALPNATANLLSGSIPGASPDATGAQVPATPSPRTAPPGAASTPGAPPFPGGNATALTATAPANAVQGPARTATTPRAPALTAQVPAAMPSGQPASAGAAGDALTAPLRFTGLVTSVTHAGNPVLSTPLGTLSLDVEARLPGGSRVALELTPGALPKAVESPAPMASASSLGHAWPALEEALTVLNDTGVGAAQGTPRGVPQPGGRLASGMLFFLAALSGGNLGRWLGAEALQTLRASGRDALVGRLSRDLAQMGRMADGASTASGPTGDWRLLPIPLWDGDHVHQLRLFLRQHENRREGGNARDRRDPTRFILELEMSSLGEMQLDGLVRNRRFDLMMRTRSALPEDMRREIRQIFDDANQAAGYSGNLGFQASADWRFLPIGQDAAQGEPPELVV